MNPPIGDENNLSHFIKLLSIKKLENEYPDRGRKPSWGRLCSVSGFLNIRK